MAQDINGLTPLHHAIISKQHASLELLLKALPKSSLQKAICQQKTLQGNTVFQLAVSNNLVRIVLPYIPEMHREQSIEEVFELIIATLSHNLWSGSDIQFTLQQLSLEKREALILKTLVPFEDFLRVQGRGTRIHDNKNHYQTRLLLLMALPPHRRIELSFKHQAWIKCCLRDNYWEFPWDNFVDGITPEQKVKAFKAHVDDLQRLPESEIKKALISGEDYRYDDDFLKFLVKDLHILTSEQMRETLPSILVFMLRYSMPHLNLVSEILPTLSKEDYAYLFTKLRNEDGESLLDMVIRLCPRDLLHYVPISYTTSTPQTGIDDLPATYYPHRQRFHFFKVTYSGQSGDDAKRSALTVIKHRINQYKIKDIKQLQAYMPICGDIELALKVIKSPQGLLTWMFGLKTDSEKAMERMFSEVRSCVPNFEGLL